MAQPRVLSYKEFQRLSMSGFTTRPQFDEAEDCNASKCCPCGRRNGNTVTLYRKTAAAKLFPFVCLVGPHWTCMPVVYALITVPTICFIYYIARHVHPAFVATTVLLAIVALCAYTVTACSDPGYVKRRSSEADPEALVPVLQPNGDAVDPSQPNAVSTATTPDPNRTLCGKCNVYRSVGTQHCQFCDVCVSELDHHCPWTGKCIGADNLYPFYAFVASSQMLLCYVVISTIVYCVTRAA